MSIYIHIYIILSDSEQTFFSQDLSLAKFIICYNARLIFLIIYSEISDFYSHLSDRSGPQVRLPRGESCSRLGTTAHDQRGTRDVRAAVSTGTSAVPLEVLQYERAQAFFPGHGYAHRVSSQSLYYNTPFYY